MKYLIIDGYTKEARDELVAGGASMAADLYDRMLSEWTPEPVSCDKLFPSDAGAQLPDREALSEYDGVTWTGCSLGCNDGTPQVEAQIRLQQDVFATGVPSFGSCWAAQIAVVAAGGSVKPNPKGREMGISRKIALTDDGRNHPLHLGRRSPFDAFTSHDDEITELPANSTLLSGNAFTEVQSVAVSHEQGTFWGVQYHPEYDLHEMARLIFCRVAKLMKRGFFESREDALRYIDDLESLHQSPERMDLAWRLGIDEDVMDPEIRCLEVRNWIQHLVAPNKQLKDSTTPTAINS